MNNDLSERALILAPQGRDAFVAAKILHEGGLLAEICSDLPKLLNAIGGRRGRGGFDRRGGPQCGYHRSRGLGRIATTVVGFSFRASDRTRRRIGKKSHGREADGNTRQRSFFGKAVSPNNFHQCGENRFARAASAIRGASAARIVYVRVKVMRATRRSSCVG